MTRQEALAEAQRRWAPSGNGRKSPRVWDNRADIPSRRYKVGWCPIAGGAMTSVFLGAGPSWEEAFRDADARSSR